MYCKVLGPVAQSVASQTADPGIARSIPARSYVFFEIYHEIISLVIFFHQLIQEGLLSVTSKSMCTKYWLTASKVKLVQEKVWLGELTVAVDRDVKHQPKPIKVQCSPSLTCLTINQIWIYHELPIFLPLKSTKEL